MASWVHLKQQEGQQYILVVVDHFSRWCEDYGAPHSLVSDWGAQFLSKLIDWSKGEGNSQLEKSFIDTLNDNFLVHINQLEVTTSLTLCAVQTPVV